MALYGGLYPKQYKFKYPKAGEANSIVSAHLYGVKNKKQTQIDLGEVELVLAEVSNNIAEHGGRGSLNHPISLK